MFNQMTEMFRLQEQLEIRISGEDWRKQDHNYALCIHMECAEVIDHIGWKHWKKDTTNWDAIAVELIDIWHFAMAHKLMNGGNTSIEALANETASDFVNATEEWKTLPPSNMVNYCLGMGYAMIAQGVFPLGNFIGAMKLCNMTFQQLYRLYISKHVLNTFRQDRGYKTGEYVKVWGGREDNEHLMELSEGLGIGLNSEKLYEVLTLRYRLMTGKI